VEAKIEVNPLRLVVELNEAEEAGAGIESVFESSAGFDRREASRCETGRRNGMGGSDDYVSPATESRAELRGRAVTIVKLPAADDRLAA
jgi:hypothetical protein